MRTEVQILLEAFESVRNLSKFYISKLNKNFVHNRLEFNGVKLNSAHWILAHLIWTERMLITRGIGGKEIEKNWLDEYCIGSNPAEVKTRPSYEELLKLLDEVHARAVKVLNGTKDEQLDEPNHIDLSFGGKSDKRALLKHAIRHEPMHIGQLSWILKVNNVDMV